MCTCISPSHLSFLSLPPTFRGVGEGATDGGAHVLGKGREGQCQLNAARLLLTPGVRGRSHVHHHTHVLPHPLLVSPPPPLPLFLLRLLRRRALLPLSFTLRFPLPLLPPLRLAPLLALPALPALRAAVTVSTISIGVVVVISLELEISLLVVPNRSGGEIRCLARGLGSLQIRKFHRTAVQGVIMC